MPSIRIVTEDALRAAVRLDLETIARIEAAFAALATGSVVTPPILSMAIAEHNGEVDVKTAYAPELPSFAIKISPGFFDNPKLGLPSTSGLMTLFSATTGQLEAVLLDNGYLTDVRTAAAGAVAARWLAREDAETACIVGAGAQARLQLEALRLVRPIKQATIWARDPAKAALAAEDLSLRLGIAVRPADDLEAAVRAADVIVTTTPAAEPLIRAAWLGPGRHVTAMGSDQAHKSELEPACLAKADLYAPDLRAQTERLGELRAALAAGAVEASRVFPELGAIVAGRAAGRPSPEALTIADLTGTGVQDTAVAHFAMERVLASGAGEVIDN